MNQSFVLLEIKISIEKIILFFFRPTEAHFNSNLPTKLRIDLVLPNFENLKITPLTVTLTFIKYLSNLILDP